MGGEYWWVASAVVVVGWLVVRHFNRVSEDRKEAREQINEIIKLVEEVESHCHQYFCKKGDDVSLTPVSQDIKCKLKHIGKRINALERRIPGSGKTVLFIQFRKAATSKLDDSRREALPDNDVFYHDLGNSSAGLLSILETEFEGKYGKS